MKQLKIGNKSYIVRISYTQQEKNQGLQQITRLDDNEGMLFVYDEPQDVSFWMKNTSIPLDIIFINEDEEVISVKQGFPMSEESITESNVQYVLEVNQNSGVQPGDELDFEDEDVEKDLPKMKVLAPDGSIQMELDGGERIVSRRETKILIKKAKKAYKSKDDKDYKALGRYIFKVFNKQDNREPEYVDSPK